MQLNTIKNNPGANVDRKRVGRGIASGTGKTSGAGQKGQKSRSGVSLLGFEGGQMPIYRRLPKRGFNNIFKKEVQTVNLCAIEDAIGRKVLDVKKVIDAAALEAAGLIRDAKKCVKLLAKGELKSKLDLSVNLASKAAIEMVEKAKGKVSLIEFNPNNITEETKKKRLEAKEKTAAKKAAKSKKK